VQEQFRRFAQRPAPRPPSVTRMARRYLLVTLVTAGILAGGGVLYAATGRLHSDRNPPAISAPGSQPDSAQPAPPTDEPSSAAAPPAAAPPAAAPPAAAPSAAAPPAAAPPQAEPPQAVPPQARPPVPANTPRTRRKSPAQPPPAQPAQQQGQAQEQPAPPPDAEPPTVPTNLTGVNAGNDVDNLRVVLDWDASSDNVGVVGYRIDRDGVQVHVVDDGSTDDTDWPRCGHVYDYAVRAYDAAGNLSDPATVTVNTVCYSG